jgi:hypothetical protein
MPFFYSACPPLRHKLSLKVGQAARNGISMQSCATNQDFLYRRAPDYQVVFIPKWRMRWRSWFMIIITAL